MSNIPMGWLRALFMDLSKVPDFVQRAPVLSQQLADKAETILIAAFPKSGSTFVSNVLIEALGYERTHLCVRYGRNEQDLNLARLVLALERPSVAQHHLRATEANLDLIRLFRIKTIILTRSIFDIIPSSLDHHERESTTGPGAFLSPEVMQLSREDRADLLIDHAVPWYAQLYVSWAAAFHNHEIEALWATYEDLVADEHGFFAQLLQLLGHDDAIERIPAAIDAARGGGSRINVGRTGRGAEQLTAAQQQRIRDIVARYQWVDFEAMGIAGAG